jgi:uncharacterized protein YggE
MPVMARADVAAEAVPIQVGQQTIAISVQVTYALK